MSDEFDYTIQDQPPTFDLSDVSEQPAEGSVHQCIDCSTPVPRTKGGRQFDRCIDCRRIARGATSTGSTTAKTRSANWEGPLASQLVDMINGIGYMVSIADQTDGAIIMGGSDKLGNSLIGPARTNKKVRTALENMVTGGAWAGVVMASMAIVVPILAHHNLLPSPPKKVKTQPYDAPKSHEGHISV